MFLVAEFYLMLNFDFQNPTKLIFGKGQLEHLKTEVPKYGNKVLVTYGGKSAKVSGLLERVVETLKSINVEIFVNEKKVGVVDQTMKIKIPAKGEFTVPLEVGLNMKELGFMETVFGMLGGKKFDVRYEGHLKVSYHGVPIKVPVKYKDQIRVRF